MAKMPDPWNGLKDEIRRLWKAIEELRRRSPFTGTGVHPNGQQGLDSDNYSPGASGFSLNGGTGKAEFKDITLYDLPNSMLATPVDGKPGNANGSGFALSAGSLVELAGQDILVPNGFTRGIGGFGASVFSYNPNTTGGSNGIGGDAIYCQAGIAGTTSHLNPVGVSGSSGYATSFSNAGFDLSGLTPGSTIRLSVYGCSAYQGLAANVNNYANAWAAITWLR